MNIPMLTDPDISAHELIELAEKQFHDLLRLVLDNEISPDQTIDLSDLNQLSSQNYGSDEQMADRLGEMGCDSKVICWLIPVSEIEKELENIKSYDKLVVFAERALQWINLYLRSKISAA
ncbi:MAG: hypothetical protein JNK79_16985, partial [Chitinophagaceae bacterium]|nr:hypothetical protein [Chitinophagaceae bacterium]